MQKVCERNIFIQQVIPCKYTFHCILIIIILICPCLTFAALGNASFLGHSGQLIAAIFAILTISLMIVSNALLLYFYIKGLHVFAHKHYFRVENKENENVLLDDRIHELMLEATRYFVVFGGCMIVDIVFGIIGCCAWMHRYHQGTESSEFMLQIIVEILTFTEITMLLSAIYLSFKFSHKKYEKICYYCDDWTKSYCHNITRRRQRKYFKQYQLAQLQENLLIN